MDPDAALNRLIRAVECAEYNADVRLVAESLIEWLRRRGARPSGGVHLATLTSEIPALDRYLGRLRMLLGVRKTVARTMTEQRSAVA